MTPPLINLVTFLKKKFLWHKEILFFKMILPKNVPKSINNGYFSFNRSYLYLFHAQHLSSGRIRIQVLKESRIRVNNPWIRNLSWKPQEICTRFWLNSSQKRDKSGADPDPTDVGLLNSDPYLIKNVMEIWRTWHHKIEAKTC